MKVLLKRSSILILLALVLLSFGCGPRNTPIAPVVPTSAPPPAPPPPALAPPTIALRADNTTIIAGQSVTLTYTATNATSVTLQPGGVVLQPTTTGTRQVTPTAATTYTATAIGPGGTASSAGVTINVNPVVAAPPRAPAPVAPPPPRANTSIDTIFTSTMMPVLFDYDKSAIRPGEETKLLNMASFLKQNATLRFTIGGHADERGGQEYNIALGDDRAAAVKKYLAGQGIAEARMTTVSYGEERPLCSAETEECWQMNRRAAFVRQP